MTDEVKKSIFEMRKSGLGYKAIASALNMSRDSVKAYCKRNDLGGEGCFVEANLEARKGEVCEKCGTPIAQPVKGRARRFCSEECRRNWWNSHLDQKRPKSEAVYLLTCSNCGRRYESYGNKTRRYCSHRCYIENRFYKEMETDANQKNPT